MSKTTLEIEEDYDGIRISVIDSNRKCECCGAYRPPLSRPLTYQPPLSRPLSEWLEHLNGQEVVITTDLDGDVHIARKKGAGDE